VSTHTAIIEWSRGDQIFTDGKYSRAHTVSFDGGVSIAGSSAPSVVRAPLSKVKAADPEEMLVASLSMCHMLTFLDLARKAGFVIGSYLDDAEGVMGKDDRGRLAVTHVTLKLTIACVALSCLQKTTSKTCITRRMTCASSPTVFAGKSLLNEIHRLCVAQRAGERMVVAAPPAAQGALFWREHHG
jgi:organic hydroperoxide reductase OsmC/OhrA